MKTNNRKALLAGALVLAVALCLGPISLSDSEAATGGAADVDGVTYATLQEAIDAAVDGSTVTLLDDISLAPPVATGSGLVPLIHITKDIVLEMNGKTISWDQYYSTIERTITPCFLSIESTVTITGNGTIDSELGNYNSYGIDIKGGRLTIENGTFTGALTAVQIETGHLTIEDGTFILAKTCGEWVAENNPSYVKYAVNVIDRYYQNGSATIEITGGSFCYDYSNNPEGAQTTYIADGLTVTLIDGLYRVAKEVAPADPEDVIDVTDDRIVVDMGTTKDATIRMPSVLFSIAGDSALNNIVVSADERSFSQAPNAISSYEITIVTGASYTADITVAAKIPSGHQALVYYIDESGNLVPVEVVSFTSSTVTFRTTHTTPFVIMSESVTPPVSEDDELPFPPGHGSNQGSTTTTTKDSSDDTTKVIAAAAAVVVIMLAAVALMVNRNN